MAQTDPDLKAKPTYFNGVAYRSRLEARWALFFTLMHAEFKYEPQHFDVGGGTNYLPDFYFPQLKTYVEIKPVAPTASEDYKCWGLARATNEEAVLLWGTPADVVTYGHGLVYRSNPVFVVGYRESPRKYYDDDLYYPTVCTSCGRFDFVWAKKQDRICDGACVKAATTPDVDWSAEFATNMKFQGQAEAPTRVVNAPHQAIPSL
jgi:hypothetical protein